MDLTHNPTESQKKEVAPSTALAYLDPHYWDERFSNEEHYEWFKDYSHFKHLIQRHVHPNSSTIWMARFAKGLTGWQGQLMVI